MKKTLKEIFTSWKVILLVFLVVYFLFFQMQLQLSGTEGVSIRSILPNSSAANGGIENPSQKLKPLSKERILSVNGLPVNSVEQYFDSILELEPNTTVRVETNNNVYTLLTQMTNDLGIKVVPAPTSNIRKGLDLEGGTRVLLNPGESISASHDLFQARNHAHL